MKLFDGSCRVLVLVGVAVTVGCEGTVGGGVETQAGDSPYLGEPSSMMPWEPTIPGVTNPAAPGTSTCGARMDLGASRLLRLTRAQYRNAVRDLLQVGSIAADALPADEKLMDMFDSNGTAPVDALITEAYQSAAESVAAEAITHMSSFLPCNAATAGEDTCARQLVTDLGKRAYRRPLLKIEIDELMALFAGKKAADGYNDAIRLVLQAILQSPLFLYRPELSAAPAGQRIAALDDHELATRLSFFLFNSIPDDKLLDAAAARKLSTVDGLSAEARRMLADERAAETVWQFHAQWLGLGNIEELKKSGEVYPDFNAQLATSMEHETAAFVKDVVRTADGKLRTLFSASYSFIDAPLAALYGLPAPAGLAPGKMARTNLPKGKRAGLFTQASFLATHAHLNQASPIKRGVSVLRGVAGMVLPPPPPNVNVTPPAPVANVSLRARFDAITQPAECRVCHGIINPVGYAFEAYDGIGRRHETEGGAPVDESGKLMGAAFNGPTELANILVGSEAVRHNVVEQWFRFALGRTSSLEDACTLEALDLGFAKSDLDVRSLILSVVASEAFRFRRTN